MAREYLIRLMVRVIFPAGLLLSIGLRPFGLSIFYLLLFFISPNTHTPSSSGKSKIFLIFSLVLSSCLLIVHIAWHSVLLYYSPYPSLLETLPLMKTIGLNLGLVSFADVDPALAIYYLSPEIIMICVSTSVLFSVKKLTANAIPQSRKKAMYQHYPLLTDACSYVCLLLILISGILRPSALSGIYFLMFIGIATAWSLGRSLARSYEVVAKVLMIIMALHVIALLAYQWTMLNEMLTPDEQIPRILGLVKFISINPSTMSFQYVFVQNQQWSSLASPLVTLLAYYVLSLISGEIYKPKVTNAKLVSDQQTSREPTETDPLVGGTIKASSSKSSMMRTTRLGSNRSETSSFARLSDDEVQIEENPTITDDIIAATVDFFQVLVRSSYIPTTITMMAWSIMFHSWLAFIFLMWANIVWLRQDQRSFMLKTSPILVIYAIFLLMAEFIDGMNLKEDELPSNITGINIQQIGLGRKNEEPFHNLLIKSLFTCMFWMTLKQLFTDIKQRKMESIVSSMGTTTPSTSGIATAKRRSTVCEERSRLFIAISKSVRMLCARYWIYVVVIMLFVIGINGQGMTIFRIIYMMLFIVFILVFQLNWYLWRRLMYGFWITVIMYSMVYLILLYVYQFDNFPSMIEQYLFIDQKLQHDLGLDTYKPADLFVKLLTPTLFLIITIMQVHYFHKDFLMLSESKLWTSTVSPNVDSRRPSQMGSTMKDDIPPLPSEQLDAQTIRSEDSINATENVPYKRKLSNLKKKSPLESTITSQPSETLKQLVLRMYFRFINVGTSWVDTAFIVLELHITKIIFLAVMLLCVFNVCALHAPLMLMITPATMFSPRKARFVIMLMSILISVYFIVSMIYQIPYIRDDMFESKCEINTTNNVVFNNAEWLGLTKANDKGLASLLKGYIALIALFIINSLVTYRRRLSYRNERPDDERVQYVFPEVTRAEADLDLIHCFKYLANHCFYKFGVEITLICLLGAIGSRMDVYAVFYSIWLLIMVRLERAKQAKIWPLFYSNLLVFIPIQYFMALGIVPFLCTEYPWNEDSDLMKSVRSWFFLPDHLMPPHSTKIIFDFVLLMFVSCQYKVFNIESTFGESYHGGSNKMDVGDNWEKPGFVNPVPDFLNRIDTWLDVVKRVIFLGMMWVTLAIMFLTGTNRVNLFSIGYLIGSFIFLWQGTEFYLRPKDIILKWWRRLILYNVVVVMSKSLLQAVGCIYGSTLQAKSCWLVQLLAIGCIDKFSGGDFSHFIHMDLTKYRVSTNTKCQVPQEDIGLAWDGVCFAFLILQHRLFRSYYFYRIIDECKAATILASRGAELIEEIRQKQMASQEVHEKKILEKIKVKMEKIKANQKRVQGFLTKEPLHHDLDEDATEMSQQVPLVMDTESGSTTPKGFHTPISEHSPPPSPQFTTSLSAYLEPQLSEPKDQPEEPADHSLRLRRKPSHHSYQPRYKPPSSHQKAVLSGDYYMFDDFDDTELQLKEEESSSDDDEPIGMGIGKLLSTVLKTDLNRAIQMRRASAPLVRPSRKISITSGPMSYPHDIQTQRTRPPVVDVILPKKEEAGQYSDVEDYDSMIENETIVDKMKRWIEIAGSFISSLLSTLIRWLNKHSRDYRYISRILSAEKKLLMQKEGFGIGVRVGSQQIWTPQPENNILRVKSNRKLSSLSVPSIRIVAPSMERGLEQLSLADDDSIANQSMFSLQSVLSKTLSSLEDDSMFHRERSNLLHFFYSLWFVILAHTDVLCYIMVFINQVQSATILSIPLPLMVFLWGTLSVPRPSKTFWITLIAYTEIIVLVKSMFQFEILPWNQKEIPDHFPFAAPRIIGIERKPNYALYDLLLLLMIFLHRSILKSLGLWVESPVGSDEDLEVKYKLTTDDAKMIAEGNAEEVGLKYLRKHEKEFRYQTNIDENSEKIVKIKNITEAGTSRGPKKLNIEALSPNEDVETTITITTNLADVEDRCFFCLSLNRYCDPMRVFFKRMLSPGSRHTTDVYAYMFLCDFINFLVVIFGFAAFGTHQGDGGVKAYLEENKVPIPFLIMLILQFALIVIDRALYLRKFIMGKIMFQYALIIGVHVWMFFVLPFITERTFNALIPPPMWYMVKCIYLLLSAYQIRCGYPRRLIGNFLSKSYGFVNMILFRGFMAVPFVFELRTLMDWIWTDTSMTLADWLKMEDIFASVFLLKCSRHIENEYPQARGSKKSTVSKYLIGGSVLAFVIAIIWFPLVLFALGNTVGEANAPTDVTVKISIGPFLPIYQMSAQAHNIRRFTEQEFNQLSGAYPRDRTAQTFLSNYMYSDVVMVILNPNSTNTWAISPPEMNRLEQETASNSSLNIKLSYVITHPSNSAQNSPVIEASRVVALPDAKSVERDTLLTLLYGNASSDAWVNVNYLFPKFVKVFNKGEAVPAYQLMPEIPDQKQRPYRGVFIRLERENDELYWRVKENCSDGLMFSLSTDECDMLVMYTFNDRIFPETLNFISAGGIIGLYTTFVFLAARLLHGFFSGIYTKIMFDDLPNVDRVLQLCLDIYLVREALELSLEEDLFAKLVFLYRSPETMIKWSRLKEDDALALTEPESSVQQPR